MGDNWVVLKLKSDDPHYRVLEGTSGGYLTGDSWRMNSGIVDVEVDGDYYLFHGTSGSCYRCHKDAYGLRMNCAYVYDQLKEMHGDKVELMPEDTDWLSMDWIIGKEKKDEKSSSA